MTSPTPTTSSPQLSNKQYDFLKLAATVLLPALGALYFTLSQVWGLPGGDKVTGTIAALNLFAGVVVKFSQMLHNASAANFDGAITFETNDDGGTNLRMTQVPVDALLNKDQIVMKVIKP